MLHLRCWFKITSKLRKRLPILEQNRSPLVICSLTSLLDHCHLRLTFIHSLPSLSPHPLLETSFTFLISVCIWGVCWRHPAHPPTRSRSLSSCRPHSIRCRA